MQTESHPVGREPAFPFAYQGPTTAPEVYYGIEIRDYLAAKALAPLLASYRNPVNEIESTEEALCIAEAAYAMADAMLKARAQ